MGSHLLQHKVHIEWSPNFAYAIGLITSDGNLSKSGRHILFASKDLELVTKFKRALGLNNKTYRSGRGGEIEKNYYSIRFGDKAFYQFLNTIGLTAAKSKTIQSVQVPNEFFADFFRGLFDGDGSFYTFWDTRWPNSFGFKTTVASASKDFLEWLKDRLTVLYGVSGHIKKGAGVYEMRYVKGDSRILFEKMYYREGLLYLKRKHRKIKDAFELDEKVRKGYSSNRHLKVQMALPR